MTEINCHGWWMVNTEPVLSVSRSLSQTQVARPAEGASRLAFSCFPSLFFKEISPHAGRGLERPTPPFPKMQMHQPLPIEAQSAV